VVYSGRVCHAGRYTTVNKSEDSKLQYGLVNVQPVAAAAAAAAAVEEAEAVVVADGFESYKSATRSASLAGTLGEDDETLLDADADLAADDGAADADFEAAAYAVLPLTGGWLCRSSTSLGTACSPLSLASSSLSSLCCFFRAAAAGRRSENIHSSRGFPDEGDEEEARGVMLLGISDSVAIVDAVVEGFYDEGC
jgi:hypothetical protein